MKSSCVYVGRQDLALDVVRPQLAQDEYTKDSLSPFPSQNRFSPYALAAMCYQNTSDLRNFMNFNVH